MESEEVLSKIQAFIARHHVLALGTVGEGAPQTCALFYAYDAQHNHFIVASDEKTEHIQNVLATPEIAASIYLETRTVGQIEGIQLKGQMVRSDEKTDRALYFNAFSYARVMHPVLWRIEPHHIKLTDNKLGFGKKLVWTR